MRAKVLGRIVAGAPRASRGRWCYASARNREMPEPLLAILRRELTCAADPAKAPGMQAYMNVLRSGQIAAIP